MSQSDQHGELIRQRSTSNLDNSAIEFLQRLDALTEVTSHHYLWLTKHPDDHHEHPSEIQHEIDQAFHQSPFTPNSSSGSIRSMTKDYDALRSQAKQKWPEGFVFNTIYPYLLSRWRILRQIFRLPILLFTFYIAFYTSLPSPIPYIFEVVRFYALFISAIAQLYTLFFDDEIFQRRWLGYQSKVKAGLYHRSDDQLTSTIIKSMATLKEPFVPSSLHLNGDISTLLSGLTTDTRQITSHRRWLRSQVDLEAVLVDITFPTNETTKKQYFDQNKPIILFIHGLASSTTSPYIKVHVDYYTKRGYTALALNARGFGGSFIIRDPFHGARISDLELFVKCAHVGAGNGVVHGLHTTARADPFALFEPQLHSLNTCFRRGITPMNIVDNREIVRTPVFAMGFSMGGIILANYVSSMGKFTGLSAAFSVGAYGDRLSATSLQPQRDWEGYLAESMKETLHPSSNLNSLLSLPRVDERGIPRTIDTKAINDATSLKEFDIAYTSIIAKKPNVQKYYQSFSFAVDYKLDNIYTPLFIMNPADDPVLHVDSLYPAVQSLLPRDKRDFLFADASSKYFRKPVKNLMIYVPNQGGHLASYRSWNDNWGYLCELSFDFFSTYVNIMESKIPLQPLSVAAYPPSYLRSSTTNSLSQTSSHQSLGQKNNSQQISTSTNLHQLQYPQLYPALPSQGSDNLSNELSAHTLFSTLLTDSLKSPISSSYLPGGSSISSRGSNSTGSRGNDSPDLQSRRSGRFNPMHHLNPPTLPSISRTNSHSSTSSSQNQHELLQKMDRNGTNFKSTSNLPSISMESINLNEQQTDLMPRQPYMTLSISNVPNNPSNQPHTLAPLSPVHHNHSAIFAPKRPSPPTTTSQLQPSNSNPNMKSSTNRNTTNITVRSIEAPRPITTSGQLFL